MNYIYTWSGTKKGWWQNWQLWKSLHWSCNAKKSCPRVSSLFSTSTAFYNFLYSL